MKAKQWLSDNGYGKFCNSYIQDLMDRFLKEATEQPSQHVGEVKSAEEILLNKFPLLPHSSNKEGMDRIILAMHEYHSQFPKVVLPSPDEMKSKSFECGDNAHDYIDGFNNCYNWIKSLNK